MILVSFSSAEYATSNDVKNITLLARKVHRSAFLGTPGIFKMLSTHFTHKAF